MYDFGQSRTVPSVRWRAIGSRLDELERTKNYYLGMEDRSDIKRKVNEVAVMARTWLNPVVDLSDLPFHYHVNGIHGAIEQWLASETRTVCCLRGEYPYPRHLRKSIVVVDDVSDIPRDAVVYMSNPFSATGRWDDRYLAIDNPMVLDMAYVGTTAPHRMVIRYNVEQAFWSASKTFGLGHFRTGYRFCRSRDDLQEQLKDTGYFNVLSVDVLRTALQTFDVTSRWHTVVDRYQKICVDCGLEPSDTYLIATSTDAKYMHLAREDGTLRIPIGKVLEDMI